MKYESITTTYKFPIELKAGLLHALPNVAHEFDNSFDPSKVYLPEVNAKALHPDNTVIQGIRGSGKTFWFHALQNPQLRELFGSQIGIDTKTMVTIGFGHSQIDNTFPQKNTLIELIQSGFKPRLIWQTVVFNQVLSNKAPTSFTALNNWRDQVLWTQIHPELVDKCFYDFDNYLEQNKQYHLVLFDALDHIADDWKTMNALVKGLLQVALETRSFKRIRIKIFARSDQLVFNFPDASKVMSQTVKLKWSKHDLYGLLWQYLANDLEYGQWFRDGASTAIPCLRWENYSNTWLVPELIRKYEEVQKVLFHALTGPLMGKSKESDLPYSWLPNHLANYYGDATPRQFLAALHYCASIAQSANEEYLLPTKNFKKCVQEALRICNEKFEKEPN